MVAKDVSGVLVVDKPRDMTSHDVVDIVRRLFNTRRVGHAGTLDPIATGVLVVLVGSATKSSAMLTNDEKEYSARLTLGKTTDTGDAYGKTVKASGLNGLDRKTVEDAVLSFRGEIEQTPPMFSAVKYKGRSLYKLARKGVTVDRQSRRVVIKDITIEDISLPQVDFKVVCSKGTYIRQLCADIGEKLGCGGHMSALRRSRSGDFHISRAVTLDRLRASSPRDLAYMLLNVDGAGSFAAADRKGPRGG